MAAVFTDPMKNAAADGMAAKVTLLSLHSADPGASGAANEIAGGREAPSYDPAAAGVADLDAPVPFTGMTASTTVTHIGLWGTAGTEWLGSITRDSGDAAVNAAGEYNVESAELTGDNAP